MEDLRYNRERYLAPLWEGDTVYHEICMFNKLPDGTVKPRTLLYHPEQVLAVRSYDRQTVYTEGVDYRLEGDTLFWIPTGAIVPLPCDVYALPEEEHPDWAWLKLEPPFEGVANVGNAELMAPYYVDITYTHKDGWTGPVPDNQASRLPRLAKKLQNGEPVHCLFYGDSITVGWNSSGLSEIAVDLSTRAITPYFDGVVPPYAPNWAGMITEQMAAYSGGQVYRTNRAAGGSDSGWGIAYMEQLCATFHPDVVFLAFGMNEADRDPLAYRENILKMMDYFRSVTPETEFVLISPMMPNPEILCFQEKHNIPLFEAELRAIQEQHPGVAVAPVNTMFRHLLTRKSFLDYTGNMVNHPNDFGARLYAQTILRTVGVL